MMHFSKNNSNKRRNYSRKQYISLEDLIKMKELRDEALNKKNNAAKYIQSFGENIFIRNLNCAIRNYQ